jgi:HK97 family phage major capsid protein
MNQKEKDKQLKRMVKIADSLEAMNEKAELREGEDKGVFSENEQSTWDSMIKEYDSLRNTFDTLKGPEIKTLEDVRANMKLPVNELHKSNPAGQLINENGEEIRTFNKDNLSELRSYILSQGRLGITEELSLGKAIRAIATGNWGKFAPAEARALGTATLGGQYFIPAEMSAKVIELSLAAAQVFKSGASMTPMSTKTLTIPKVLTMPEVQWKAENVAYTGSLSASFEPVVLTAKTIVAILSLSIELAEDGVGVEKSVEAMLAKSISQEIDRVCLLGTGSDNEPKGIANTTGILTEEFAAEGDIAYSNLSSAFYKLEAVNNSPNSLIMASSLFGTLDALVDLQEQPLKPPPSYEKYAKLPSNQLTEQGILGLYSNLLVGFRTSLNLEVSRSAESALTEMKILIRAYARMDCACKIANSFCLIKEAAA